MGKERQVSIRNVFMVLLIGLVGYVLGIISTMIVTYSTIDKMFKML